MWGVALEQEPDAGQWVRLLGDDGVGEEGAVDAEQAAAYDFGTLELTQFPAPPDRHGNQSRFVRATGLVLFQQPRVANVPAEVLPAFTRLRTDFSQLRHVALEVPFMLEEAAPGHSYTVVRLVVRVDTPGMSVEQMWPGGSTANAQEEGTTTTEFTSQFAGPVRVGLTRTRAVGTTQETARPPTVVDETRSPDEFGWKYQEQPGAPLYAPRRGRPRALLALPRQTRTLSGDLEFEVFTRVRRYGKTLEVRSIAADEQRSVRFGLELGEVTG